MLRRLLLIVNPQSGTKQAAKKLAQIVDILQASDFICTVMLTDRRMAASDFAREHGHEFDVIACAGGDGTFNETVNGMLQAGLNVPLGYIPTGSTNDFAASLRLSTDIPAAAQTIATMQTRQLDIGFFGVRSFSYVASFGAFTKTSYSTPQSFKNVFGHFAYLLSGVKDVWSIRSQHLVFELNGQRYEDDYIFGAISNSTSLGGVLTIDPDVVDMNDGQFEVMLIRQPRNLNDLLQITNAISRKQYSCDMITFESAASVTVTSDSPVDWSIDGEKVTSDGSTLEIRCVHDALSIITGRHGV